MQFNWSKISSSHWVQNTLYICEKIWIISNNNDIIKLIIIEHEIEQTRGSITAIMLAFYILCVIYL